MILRVFRSVAVATAIICVAISDVSMVHAQSAVKPKCPDGFEQIALEAVRRVDVASAAFGKTARRKFEELLPIARQKEAENLLKSRGLRPKDIDKVPEILLPKEPRLAQLVIRANELLSSELHMADFVESMAKRAKQFQMQRHPEASGDTLISASDLAFPAEISKELGWGPMAILKSENGRLLGATEFHEAMFSADRLLFDDTGAELSHTGSAHIWQWIMLTPLLEREFGAGAAKELWRYFRRTGSEGLWAYVFDRGESHFSDFRSPRAFSVHRLAGPHSFFGVR